MRPPARAYVRWSNLGPKAGVFLFANYGELRPARRLSIDETLDQPAILTTCSILPRPAKNMGRPQSV